MSVKTCQLCGKPLGRIRVGGDGDFCSREHRNQFRLRRGMDRLQEANKMATLMRRRDTPRHIPAGQLLAAAAGDSRPVLAPLAFPPLPLRVQFAPLSPKVSRPQAAEGVQRFANLLSELSRISAQSQHRIMTPGSHVFAAPPPARPVPGLRTNSHTPVRVAQARAAVASSGVRPFAQDRRASGAALHVTRPAILPKRIPEIGAPASALAERTRRMQPMTASRNTEAAPANPTSVSFVRRAPVFRLQHRSGSTRAGLASPLKPDGLRPAARNIQVSGPSCNVPRPEIASLLPQSRPRPQATGTRRVGALAAGPRVADLESTPAPRACSITWSDAFRVDSLHLCTTTRLRTGFAPRYSPRLKLAPANAAGEHRASKVAFTPADSTFGHAPMELHGSLPVAGGEAQHPLPVPSKPIAPDLIEEHFDAGLDRWTGDIKDWKLDAAGARPASLALFRPTLELSDYEFEFLARIETRGVTFVFRASNHSNYLKVTICLADSGRYELKYSAVIGAVEEGAVLVSLGDMVQSGTAFTVKTRARRNDFTISLDGEEVARWTDGRLPTGGVGFMAPRSDRARVYWLRLSHPGSPNSTAAASRSARSKQ